MLATLAEDPAVGAIVAVQDAPPGLDGPCIAEYSGIARGLAAAAADCPVPLVCLATLSAGHHPAFRALLGPVPALHGLRPGLFALARLLGRG